MAVQMRCRTLARQFVTLVHHHRTTLTLARTKIPSTPNFVPTPNHHFVQNRFHRSSPPVGLGIGPKDSSELILSVEEYNLAVKRIQEKSMTAVLWFAIYSQKYTTSVYEYLHNHLSPRFPHVTIYNFLLEPEDDDCEACEATLKSLNVSSTPTFHFFKNGEKVDELVCEIYQIHHFCTYLEVILEKLYKGVEQRKVPELELYDTVGVKNPDYMPFLRYSDRIHGYGRVRYGGKKFVGFKGLKKFGVTFRELPTLVCTPYGSYYI